MARTHATPDGEVPFTAEEEAAQDALEAEWAAGENDRLAEMARAERNTKLAETDWVVIKEREEGGSVSNFADWKTYRQALRDITKDYTSLDDVVWPEKP